jgi:hypothetical protein
MTITHLRRCADCGKYVPDDNIHTQHDVECEQVTCAPSLGTHGSPGDCTCNNWADVCEACCNVCNPPTDSLPQGESETP